MINRFKVCSQHDCMQCGIACIQMICNVFGKKYFLDELSEICFATTEGVSFLGMSKAFKQLGLNTVCAKVTTSIFGQSNLPCILHWNKNHFVVLYKVHRGKYYVADPSKGLLKYSLEEFKKHWISVVSNNEEKGIAMFVERTKDFDEINPVVSSTENHSFGFLLRNCFDFIR